MYCLKVHENIICPYYAQSNIETINFYNAWKEKIDNEDLPFAPVRAIRYLDTALLYLERVNNKPYKGMALKLLADIKNLETKYEESLQLARRANALFEESNFLVNWVVLDVDIFKVFQEDYTYQYTINNNSYTIRQYPQFIHSLQPLDIS